MQNGPSSRTSPRVGPTALVLGLGTLVSHGFGLSLVPALLPDIEREYQSGYGILGLAIATGLIAYAIGGGIAPRVMRSLPTRTLLLGTFALSAAGLAAVAVSVSPLVIALAVTLLGLSAPISWTATIHVGRETIPSARGGVVLAGASGGAAAGVVVDGVLVQTSASLHSWRLSFVFAACVAVALIGLATRVLPRTIAKPETTGEPVLPSFGRVLRDPSGLMIVVTSGVSGLAVFVLATFLTATAIDEMGASAIQAALLLWVAGVVGVSAALAFGRLGDIRTPTFAIASAMTIYSVALVLLVLGWSYPWLLAAVVGYGILNGPVWGLMGAAANRRFSSGLGVGAVALGLVAASLSGAVGNTVAAFWLETTGSMRVPVTALAVSTALAAVYLIRDARRPSVGADTHS